MTTSSSGTRPGTGISRCLVISALIFGILLSIAGCSGSSHPATGSGQDQAPGSGGPWFAGYVDFTLPSGYELDRPPTPAAAKVILSFVVADPTNPCTPSWGGHYTMGAASAELGLDQRISRLRANGGEVTVSFGGQLGVELATTCSDQSALSAAYLSVIDRYGLDTIDVDIEGSGLGDPDAGLRRAEAFAGLQLGRDERSPLNVWLTLPVTPRGLTDGGVRAVEQMLDAGVELAGVNIMIMNYSAGRVDDHSMVEASTAAARSAHAQLDAIYEQAGQPLGAQQLWEGMGLTPMIGHNDVDGEVLDLAAARKINQFAHARGIGRISMWSLNRDRSCSRQIPDREQPSNTCSGLDQDSGSFSRILGTGYTGSIR